MKLLELMSADKHKTDLNQPDCQTGKVISDCRVRAFELDALRGFAVLMMILHHFIYDLRYLLELDVFAFQEAWWFDALLRPIFLFVFLAVSGVCCTFSRSNAKRGLRMAVAALVLSLITIVVWQITDLKIAVFFNILHLLALGTLVFAGMEKIFFKKQKMFDFILIASAAILLWAGSVLNQVPAIKDYWLLPVGILPLGNIGMGDYMPIIPWLGFFLIGAVIGRLFYNSGTSPFNSIPNWLKNFGAPFVWTGKKALLIYIVHQPILLIILFGLRKLAII